MCCRCRMSRSTTSTRRADAELGDDLHLAGLRALRLLRRSRARCVSRRRQRLPRGRREALGRRVRHNRAPVQHCRRRAERLRRVRRHTGLSRCRLDRLSRLPRLGGLSRGRGGRALAHHWDAGGHDSAGDGCRLVQRGGELGAAGHGRRTSGCGRGATGNRAAECGRLAGTRPKGRWLAGTCGRRVRELRGHCGCRRLRLGQVLW